jgi:transposase
VYKVWGENFENRLRAFSFPGQVDFDFSVRTSTSIKMTKRTYHQYSVDTKHFILQQYKRSKRGCGFQALAKKYGIHGGKHSLQYWYSIWDGTPNSLQKHTTSHKRRKLNEEQVQQHIRGYVECMNQQGDQVIYQDIKENVEQKTGQLIAYSTLARYGYKKAHISYKRTTCTLTTDGM